ncbi:MAG TPA: membrane protein insertase YidC [Methylomirabilota bacterium]
MEKRALIAIALSIAILLGWQFFFGMQAEPPGRPPASKPEATAPTPPAGSGAPVPQAVPLPRAAVAAPPVAEVVTPLYRASFAGDGSVTDWAIEHWTLRRVLISGALRPLAVAVHRPGQAPELVALVPDASRVEVSAAAPVGRLTFRGTTADGLRIRRTLEFHADSFRVGATLELEGSARSPDPLDLVMYWTTPVAKPGATPEEPWHTFGEAKDGQHLLGRILVDQPGADPAAYDAPPPALLDSKDAGAVRALKEPRLVPDAIVGEEHRWAALEDDFFIAALMRRQGSALGRGRATDVAQVGFVFRGIQPAAGQAWQGGGDLYVGPKAWDRLRAQGVGLEAAQARNYGRFAWVLFPMWWFCVPLLWLMNLFGTWLPGQNYGVAIILLTVLVKVVFYPLSLKSMRSMKQMQALQPKLNALRSKYKSDPQRFQREQMEIFKKEGVNPMGGCLPMVVQIPIFYALYLTLQYSVELQGAPFMLWITDLSKKDPYYVLPILMGISMLWQQKMTPTVGDPRQTQIMMIMPVVFTFMFLEFPTGLVLYWLVNNVLTIGQQYLIDRSWARSGAGGGPGPGPKGEAGSPKARRGWRSLGRAASSDSGA